MKRERAAAEVRRSCLSLPETTEVESWGHPCFRAGKKTFAALEVIERRPSLAVRIDALDADLFKHDRRFFPTPYGRGRWISIWLDESVEPALLRDLVRRGYRTVANKRMLQALDS